MLKPATNIRPRLSSTAGILTGIVLAILISWWLSAKPACSVRQIPDWLTPPAQRRDPKVVARPHLTWASDKCLSEAERPIDQIKVLFAEARSQTRAFADQALGWDSKLTIVSDFFQQTDEHSAFLRQKFESLVISEAELFAALDRSLAQYQQITASIEGEMLVRLRTDANDFQRSPLLATSDANALQSLFQEAIARSGMAAGFDMQAAVGRELASYVLGEIATQVGVQLGVSSGILSAGAATGWTNFGISIVLGLAIDKLITEGYDAVADPKGKLADQINALLNDMEQLIIDGSDTQPGLRSRLQQFARERSSMRETVVLRLLSTEQGGVF